MEIIYVNIVTIIFYTLSTLVFAKPFEEEKSLSDDKLHCIDSNEGGLDYEKSNPNTFSEFYKPKSRYEGVEKSPNGPFEFNQKRSSSENFDEKSQSSSVQKRQVGVVYKDETPIGILQPYQRSYRFIPVKEESSDNFGAGPAQDVSYNLPSLADIDKREAKETQFDLTGVDETYPSILTNFKIVNKLDKKRNYDTITDKNVQDLKATIRRLRSSNPRNSEQIEEELKNILDDMGLIEDEETHGVKREALEDQSDEDDSLVEDELKAENERNKRDEGCSNANTRTSQNQNSATGAEKRDEIKNEPISHNGLNKRESVDETNESHRNKRQKENELVENLKDSGDIMLSGNKSPLASSSEIVNKESEEKDADKRSFDEDNEDYESRIERQIQSKINSLKEEVKRQIEALKKRQENDDDDDSDIQRKKRQVYNTLINEETDQVNPTMHPENELKPLIRKRRDLNGSTKKLSRKKREIEQDLDKDNARLERSSDTHKQEEYKSDREKNEEGGELLGDFDEGVILKREVYNPDQEYDSLEQGKDDMYDRNKRSRVLPNLDYDNLFYNNYFYNDRMKRQNMRLDDYQDHFIPMRRRNRWNSRFRRRISEDQGIGNRPQQLSDMSDLDLFGALPKSYDGELARYKRVKRD